MEFENSQLDIDNLPSIGNIDFKGLEPQYLKVSLISNSIFWFILFAIASVFILVNDFDYPKFLEYVVFGALGIFTVLTFVLIIVGFKLKGFALRERDILYKKGIFWKSMTTIPFNRVQHCEVKQGPIERMFELAQLNIFTAGGSQSDLRIPGLTPETAQELKNFIIGKTVLDEEE